ncbi:hypothetical protein ACLRGF_00930 [Mycetocola zhadangensis]|uniref:hypothetical protein n=1 Tax=Mycetocola zhadangensis TaxID=1164595 RepID=UPI003A4E58D9
MDENTTGPSNVGTTGARVPWWRRHLALLVGVGCVVLGLIVTAATPGIVLVPVPTMGWSGSVNSSAVPPPGAAIWQEQSFVGGVIAALGAVLVAAHLGYRVGFARARRESA